MPSARPVPAPVLRMDAEDPLRERRDLFQTPADVIYLDGNSLGLLPVATPGRLAEVAVRQWGADLIQSWNRHDWIGAPRRIGDKIAGLVGAETGEVIVADSTSVNLYKLLVAAFRRQEGRKTILSEPGNFPTDLYVAEGACRTLGDRRLRLEEAADIIGAIDEDTAVVLLTHVHYKTGRRHDMQAVTRAAHARGALVLWDLSHSVGAVPLDLAGCDADLAVGCGYKYLNGGPGAPAFLYVARRLQAQIMSPLSGWMGHAAGFDFVDDYVPAPGVERFLCGTPPVLGMAALEVGVDIMAAADPLALAQKSAALCDLFIREVEQGAPALRLVTPRSSADRGSHVSFAHPNAFEICQALIAVGVVGDFRAPDVIRFGFTPLYTGFAEVWRAAVSLCEVMERDLWRDPVHAVRQRVT